MEPAKEPTPSRIVINRGPGPVGAESISVPGDGKGDGESTKPPASRSTPRMASQRAKAGLAALEKSKTNTVADTVKPGGAGEKNETAQTQDEGTAKQVEGGAENPTTDTAGVGVSGVHGHAESVSEDKAGKETQQPGTVSKDLTPQIAALTRAERRTRQEREALDAERVKLKQERDAFAQETQSIKQLQELAAKDKYAIPRHLGLDVNEWAKREIAIKKGGGIAPEVGLQIEDGLKRLQEKEAALDAKLKAIEDREAQQAQERAFSEAKSRTLDVIGGIIKGDPSKYGYTASRPNGTEVVFELIMSHYNQHGEVLQYDKACAIVEEHFERDAASYLGVKKFADTIGSRSAKQDPQGTDRASEKPQPKKGDEQEQKKPSPVNQGSLPERVANHKTSLEDRKRRAVQALTAGKR